LGLAIVVHVARLHGGHLDCLYADGSVDLKVPGRFAIRLSLPMDLLVENVAKS
jgi:two-component system osmolarity sensor histidine kinase EnvZ